MFWVFAMKKFVFALTLVSALVQPFASALSADFEPPPPPTDDLRPATYDWSGIYAGASLGFACDVGRITSVSAGPPAASSYTDLKGCGYDVNGHAGYNYQLDSIIFGLEANVGLANDNIDDNGSFSFGHGAYAGMRGRMGYAWDNTMFYGTAGYQMTKSDLGLYYAIPPGWTHQSSVHHGWTVGLGVEHAITDTIRIRAEYEYAHMGDSKGYTSCGASCTDTLELASGTIRLGVSYAF